FEFDGVLEDNVCQNHVYAISTRGLVCDVLNGVSATCLVYGMTGSGKSFTMFGGEEEAQTVRSNLIGIVPRACSEIMDAIRYRKEALNLDLECTVSVSFVEVYGNDILDLLKRGSRCGQSKVSAQRSVLDGSAEVTVNDVNDVMRLLSVGEAQKRKATTAMNARSSRAHSVFIVSLQQRCRDTGKSMNSKLFLADLGGCEQTKKSQLVAGNDRMREAVYINLGLMSLKACVEALTRGNHVPYANSKLTMLLASGLGGNSKTAVIVCAAQEDEHSSETINAFKFGQSCRQVSNTVRSQADVLGDLMKELDTEIASCEDRIRLNEKWVVKEDTREDLGGVEVKKTTVLVGAEKDRKLLNKLLAKKSQLSGSSDKDDTDSHSFGGNIGFGKAHEYGLGKKFSSDAEKENYRFNKTPKEELVPSAVLREPVKINKAAKVGRLAYSGISA
ncbi:kinesin motor protein-like protein, partial [Thalassiosira pseudonana CCMP1335]